MADSAHTRSALVALTDFSLPTLEEHRNSRCEARVLSEPGRTRGPKESIIGEIAAPLIAMFRGLGQQPEFDPLLQSLPARLRPYLSFHYLSLVLKKEDGPERTWDVPDGEGFSALAHGFAESRGLLEAWFAAGGSQIPRGSETVVVLLRRRGG